MKNRKSARLGLTEDEMDEISPALSEGMLRRLAQRTPAQLRRDAQREAIDSMRAPKKRKRQRKAADE